eukprot:4742847-Pleurochrysis_carterae.AAC.1
MRSPPVALETSRPNGRRSEGARTFWYGISSFRALRRAGPRSLLRRAQRGYRPCLYLLVQTRPTPPPSHPLTNYNYTSRRRLLWQRQVPFGWLTINRAR